MRIIVTGSRDWTDRESIRRALDSAIAAFDQGPTLPRLVHGGCGMRQPRPGEEPTYTADPPVGADAIADDIWRSWGLPREIHFARWDRHGNRAGPLRNRDMCNRGADYALAFSLGDSAGTADCLRNLAANRIPVLIDKRPRPVAPEPAREEWGTDLVIRA